MRLVEDHRRVFRQDAPEIILLERQIGEEEMMVHDDKIGVLRALVHRRHEAALKLRTFLARAGVSPGIQLRPQL